MKKGLIRLFGMVLPIVLLVPILLLVGSAVAESSPPVKDTGGRYTGPQ